MVPGTTNMVDFGRGIVTIPEFAHDNSPHTQLVPSQYSRPYIRLPVIRKWRTTPAAVQRLPHFLQVTRETSRVTNLDGTHILQRVWSFGVTPLISSRGRFPGTSYRAFGRCILAIVPPYMNQSFWSAHVAYVTRTGVSGRSGPHQVQNL